MPRTYHGRNRTQAAPRTTPRAATTDNNEKFSLKKNTKKFFRKMLMQTCVVTAILLVIYITSVIAPNLWAQIREPIRNSLEHNINFVAIYNGSIGRLFPNVMITVDDEAGDENETEFDYNYQYDENYVNNYNEYNYYDDGFFIEATEVPLEV